MLQPHSRISLSQTTVRTLKPQNLRRSKLHSSSLWKIVRWPCDFLPRGSDLGLVCTSREEIGGLFPTHCSFLPVFSFGLSSHRLSEGVEMEYIAIFIVRWNHDFKYGVNFASAGSGALPETRQGIVIDLKTQLGYFKNVSNQLKQQMGYANSKTLLSKAVYMFSVGSNDYLFPFDTNTTVLNSYTTEQYVGMVIGNITEVIQEIYNIGGRKFGFLNLGLLGCTPNGRVLEGGHSGGCFEKPTPFVKLHNLQLSTLLKGLHTKLKGFKYSLVDFYSFWEERIKHPSKYGFKEAKVACCGSGPYRGHFSCGGRRGEKEYEVLGWQQVAAKIGMQR